MVALDKLKLFILVYVFCQLTGQLSAKEIVLYVGDRHDSDANMCAAVISKYIQEKHKGYTIKISQKPFVLTEPLASTTWAIGNAHTNGLIEMLCNSGEVLVDKSWPGKGGFVVKNIEHKRYAASDWAGTNGAFITVIGFSDKDGFEAFFYSLPELISEQEDNIILKNKLHIPVFSQIPRKLLKNPVLDKTKLLEEPNSGYMLIGLNYLPEILKGQCILPDKRDFGSFFDAVQMCNGRRQEAVSLFAWAYSQQISFNPYYKLEALKARIIAAFLFNESYVITQDNHISELGYGWWTVAADGFGLIELSLAYNMIKDDLDIYTKSRLLKILRRIAATAAYDDGLYADNQTIAVTTGLSFYTHFTGESYLGETDEKKNMQARLPGPAFSEIIHMRSQLLNDRVNQSGCYSEEWRGGFDLGYNEISSWYHYLYLLDNLDDTNAIRTAWQNLIFQSYVLCPQPDTKEKIYVNGYYPNTRHKWGGGTRAGVFENPRQCRLISKFFPVPAQTIGDSNYAPFYNPIDYSNEIIKFYELNQKWKGFFRSGISVPNTELCYLLEYLISSKVEYIDSMPSLEFSQFPQYSKETFWKEYPKSYLLCVKRPAYYSYLFYNMQQSAKTRGGGGLGMFWTPQSGACIVSTSWSDILIHHIRGQIGEKIYQSFNYVTTNKADPNNNRISIQAEIGPAKMERKYTFLDDSLRCEIDLQFLKAIGKWEEIIPIFDIDHQPEVYFNTLQLLKNNHYTENVSRLVIGNPEKLLISFEKPVAVQIEPQEMKPEAGLRKCFFAAVRIQLPQSKEIKLHYDLILSKK
ncbi:MAG: hypothetical protein ABFD79_17085 [Phycisphaerales bacterium]